MRVAVTGGTGFLGSALCERLAELGRDVTVVARSRGIDILDADQLGPALEGVREVFHLAALVRSRPGPFQRVNVEGLRNVLAAAARHGVERFVYVSSFTVFGPSPGRPHQEDDLTTRERFFHGYDRSKYDAFRVLESWRSRIPVNAVFPTVVFGPGPMTEGNLLVRLLSLWHRTRVQLLPGQGRPRWNFVFVRDVVEGLLALAAAPPGRDFILGGENLSIGELADLMKKVSGRRLFRISPSNSLFRLGARAEDLVSRLTGRPPLLHPSTVDFMLADWEFSSKRAMEELGYRPRSLHAGLVETIRWMKANELT